MLMNGYFTNCILVFKIGSFVNNFESSGSLLAFYDRYYVVYYEVSLLFYSFDYQDFEEWDL